MAFMLGLAGALDCAAVAEGVETQEVWDWLVGLGCDAIQGYHLSRPLPAEAVADWLRVLSRATPGRGRVGSLPGAEGSGRADARREGLAGLGVGGEREPQREDAPPRPRGFQGKLPVQGPGQMPAQVVTQPCAYVARSDTAPRHAAEPGEQGVPPGFLEVSLGPEEVG